MNTKLIKKPALVLVLLTLAFGFACKQQRNADGSETGMSSANTESGKLNENLSGEGLEKAVFASGCFWCVEAIFQRVKGVQEAISGYAGGDEPNPTYAEVSSGSTGYAESVEVFYDPQEVDYQTLLKVFFGSHDPTTLNRQGPDAGKQYRSAIFYMNKEQKQQAEAYIQKLKDENAFDGLITTEVSALKKFYPAEDYHQEYEKNHPENSYIQNVSIPRIRKFEQKFPELLKQEEHSH